MVSGLWSGLCEAGWMTSGVPPASAADEVMRGVHRSLVARAFVELSVPDCLGDRVMTLANLASATKTEPGTLARLMRAAAATGLVVETSDGHALTEAGHDFRSDAPGNAAGWLMLMTAPWMVRAWQHLADAVRTGRSTFGQFNGQGFWEYVADHPAEAGAFDTAMTSGASARADDLFAAVDWSTGKVVVVDVGGGQGLLVARLLSRAEQVRGIVADRAEVIASPAPAALALGTRIEMIATDFFSEVPSGGDVYVLSRILHDWPDREAVAILGRCRAAMKPGARLFLLEQVAPELSEVGQTEQFDLAVKDLNMLVLVGGQERTMAEYTALLNAADLEVRAVHQGDACDIIEAALPVDG